MESISRNLDTLEDILENCRPVPFSGRVAVEKDKIYEIIDEIRLNIPNDIRQAQRIVTERDKIILDANNKASQIVKDAEIEALKLIDNHEVYKQALEEGNEIIEDSKKSARDMRLNAMDYADEILSKTEEIIRESFENVSRQNKATEDFFNKTIDVLYTNRMNFVE